MAASWTEMFPPSPAWTENDMADQTGRVFLVTGGSAGIGYEVAQTLYHLSGRVYITSRSLGSAQRAMDSIRESSQHASQTDPSISSSSTFQI
jgi:retinol dehydrogenase-12